MKNICECKSVSTSDHQKINSRDDLESYVDPSLLSDLRSALQSEIETREALTTEINLLQTTNQCLASRLYEADQLNSELQSKIRSLEQQLRDREVPEDEERGT